MMMRVKMSGLLQHLLLLLVFFLSAVPTVTTMTQSPTTTTNTTSTSSTTAAPDAFYPFGPAAGDGQVLVTNGDSYFNFYFSTPLMYFGRLYHNIYINSNGLLTFNSTLLQSNLIPIPSGGSNDFIAPLWTDLNYLEFGSFFYQEYMSGSVLSRATQDINQYFPHISFSASWALVITWDYVQTSRFSVFFPQPATPTIKFQAVLITDGFYSFVIMNYGNCAATNYTSEAGFDTVGSTNYFLIPGSINGTNLPNLQFTSNVNVPGRWAFSLNAVTQTAPDTFYPFGPAAGDAQAPILPVQNYTLLDLSTPFTYFGRTYNSIYVNSNGLLTFVTPMLELLLFSIPSRGPEDFIAPLWLEMYDYGFGFYYYQQYTSGSVLSRATHDINQYFPHISFSASSVFVVTWDYVSWNYNALNPHPAPTVQVQAVLISDGFYSFVLMNYGNCAAASGMVEAGFDTVGSTNYFLIPGSNSNSYLSELQFTSNVNVPGRWVFSLNNGTLAPTAINATQATSTTMQQTTTTPPASSTTTQASSSTTTTGQQTIVSTMTTTTPVSSTVAAPGTFYQFGPSAGDAQLFVFNHDYSDYIYLSSPFFYFGRAYHFLLLYSNGLLSFTQPLPDWNPSPIPTGWNQDLIAPLWMNRSELKAGFYYYQQYTSGSVLSRATHDINQYFPNISFSASSVFVVTWDYVQTLNYTVFLQHAAPTIQFQAVLISDGFYSFILMNYGNCAATNYTTEAGFDTVGSTNYFLIPGSINGTNLPNLQFTSNVNVPGRWAFSLTDVSKVNLLGVQLTASSFVDLTQTGNAETLLQSIKQDLVNYGVTGFKLNIRNVTRIKP